MGGLRAGAQLVAAAVGNELLRSQLVIAAQFGLGLLLLCTAGGEVGLSGRNLRTVLRVALVGVGQLRPCIGQRRFSLLYVLPVDALINVQQWLALFDEVEI